MSCDSRQQAMKIWVDLDNTPHVPFFVPIIEELEHRGHQVVVTARDAFQVYELADQMGLAYTKIGHHYGRNRVRKIVGLFWRSAQLLPFCLREKPRLAVSHGSRAQILTGNALRIPTVLITDYEHARTVPLGLPKRAIVPEVLAKSRVERLVPRIKYYRGIKEDVYVPRFKPDPSILAELGLHSDETIVVVRPPANEAHYYRPESDVMLVELMLRLLDTEDVRTVMLPRTGQQASLLRASHPAWFSDGKTIVPSRAVDGLNLMWYSDLLVSGGGTMNREAAALGMPAYSIFRGELGAVDRDLEQEGRLVVVRTPEEVWSKIQIRPRNGDRRPDSRARPALLDIVGHLEAIMQVETGHVRSRPSDSKM